VLLADHILRTVGSDRDRGLCGAFEQLAFDLRAARRVALTTEAKAFATSVTK
jgi:hypothetical protein